MNDLIKIKGGNGNVPTLQVRELGYSYDEDALYIGTNEGNKRLCGVGDITSLTAKINALEERIDALEARLKAIEDNVEEPTEPSE